MLAKLLKDWNGDIYIADKRYSIEDATSVFKTLSDDTHIKLYSMQKNVNMSVTEAYNDTVEEVTEYINKCKPMGCTILIKGSNGTKLFKLPDLL